MSVPLPQKLVPSETAPFFPEKKTLNKIENWII